MIAETARPPAGAGVAPRRSGANRTFLPYLEGLRGGFGLFIAIAHGWERLVEVRPELLTNSPLTAHIVAFGHSAVGMFLFLSGYVLGLPVASAGQRFRGGLRTFAQRRALRILPGYYAALLISVPIALFSAGLFGEGLTTKQFLISLGLHAALLHDLSNRLIVTIDGPLWSIALEWQIYFLFPLMLVPLARRFGFVPMVCAAFALGLFPTLLGALRHQGDYYMFSQACLWYIGLFALGYAAANFTVDQRAEVVRRLDEWPWGTIAILLACAVLAVVAMTPPFETTHGTRWFQDILVGFALAAQFTADAQARKRGRTTWFERLFSWQPLVFFGTFSFSLYMVHMPIIDLFARLGNPRWNDVQFSAWMYASVAAGLAFSYAFYRVFERPFMTMYRRRGDAASLRSSASVEILDIPAGATPGTS
jgi:peptidoglycan/LPS O-acetylase OafA/YrhL